MMMRIIFLVFGLFFLWSCSDPDKGFHKGVAAYNQKNYAQALEWFSRHADLGRTEARYYLAMMYERGEGTKRDDRRAAYLYRQAADQDHALSQFRLGLLFEEGRGVAQDYRQAAHWYRKAAERGVAEAQFNLGVIHDVGRGVARDERQALSWYRRAADQGHTRAQFNLGKIYAQGRSVPRNKISGHQWMNVAFALGYEPAKALRDDYARRMTSDELLAAQTKASEWLKKFEARAPKRSEWSRIKNR